MFPGFFLHNAVRVVLNKMSSVAVFDQLDVISYEEVVQLPAFNRKTLVLIGKRPGSVTLFICIVTFIVRHLF